MKISRVNAKSGSNKQTAARTKNFKSKEEENNKIQEINTSHASLDQGIEGIKNKEVEDRRDRMT